jgi:hypothetical protein
MFSAPYGSALSRTFRRDQPVAGIAVILVAVDTIAAENVSIEKTQKPGAGHPGSSVK